MDASVQSRILVPANPPSGSGAAGAGPKRRYVVVCGRRPQPIPLAPTSGSQSSRPQPLVIRAVRRPQLPPSHVAKPTMVTVRVRSGALKIRVPDPIPSTSEVKKEEPESTASSPDVENGIKDVDMEDKINASILLSIAGSYRPETSNSSANIEAQEKEPTVLSALREVSAKAEQSQVPSKYLPNESKKRWLKTCELTEDQLVKRRKKIAENVRRFREKKKLEEQEKEIRFQQMQHDLLLLKAHLVKLQRENTALRIMISRQVTKVFDPLTPLSIPSPAHETSSNSSKDEEPDRSDQQGSDDEDPEDMKIDVVD